MKMNFIRKIPVISYLFLTLFILTFSINILLSDGIKINFNNYDDELLTLSRFWTNTGFSPPSPINETDKFLLSNDVKLNLELISSLPNGALTHIRTHWILELIQIKDFSNTTNLPIYDFSKFEKYLKQLIRTRLKPSIEFMGNPSGFFKNKRNTIYWYDLVKQLLNRLTIHKNLNEWNWETWNEPDLNSYNTLNFSLKDYMNYLHGVTQGLHLFNLKVRGPAGLFKNYEKHPFCWNVLKECNLSIKNCPIDILTFHRKGNGTTRTILNGGIELIETIFNEFPNLKNISISNDEADPISGWSKPYEFHSDVRYASMIVQNVLLHWNAKLKKTFKNLESISHDNAFLSFHPFEFNQRTLLARFQMNLTNPPHVQFIQKPVYAALGMLGNFGELAGSAKEIITKIGDEIIYLTSRSKLNSPFYSCIILTHSNDSWETMNPRSWFNITITGLNSTKDTFAYLVEGLQKDITDPVSIWRRFKSPSYPNETLREIMRENQSPKIIDESIDINGTSFQLNLSLRNPWILMIRICSRLIKMPRQPRNIRFHKINQNEVIIIWSESHKKSRCIKTYEVYFKSINYNSKWINLTRNQHIPFLSYQHQVNMNEENKTVSGYYRVRSKDFFNRYGHFSRERIYVS